MGTRSLGAQIGRPSQPPSTPCPRPVAERFQRRQRQEASASESGRRRPKAKNELGLALKVGGKDTENEALKKHHRPRIIFTRSQYVMICASHPPGAHPSTSSTAQRRSTSLGELSLPDLCECIKELANKASACAWKTWSNEENSPPASSK